MLITPMMQYLELLRLGKVVDKLNETLDPALQRIRDDVDDLQDMHDDHETRIREMERRQWIAIGIASFISAGGVGLILQFTGR